ncbi:Fc receptor-like protein 5 isoform X2 [Rhincodon typus]|uniref:Fc receptor-like protein 5 isoform X2 n=1 Tax=Rhincodon typus TaxID=259920 RepID=UPI002030D3AC|nr:Fc receptor-like protein 5 isoform X2 [Rhincodon typus]
MLKVIFPILSLVLLETSETESQNDLTINSVKLKHNLEDVGDIKEGSNITLTCSVDILTASGQPPHISYLIYKGQKDVLLKRDTIEAQEFQYVIQSARPSHSGYYHCEVTTGSQREESTSLFITVTGNLQTPVLTIQPMEVVLGDSTELCCTSEEIPPLRFIFYRYKNGPNPQRLHDTTSNNKSATHRLKVTADAEKNYSCTVEVSATRSISKHSEIVQLTVHSPFSDQVFEIKPSNEIFEGDNLTTECRVTPLFPHVKLQLIIMKDTTPIRIGNTSSVVFSKTVNAADTGKYGCMVKWKSLSQTIKRQVTVAVPVSVPTLMSTPTDGNVVKDGFLNLSCAVLGGSYPITYKFYQDTSENPLHQITLNATKAVHHIVSVKIGHSGKYSCEASNSADHITRTERSQYVIITVKVPVSSPTIKCSSLKDVYKTGEWVILLCHSTSGTVPITYSLFSNKRFIYSISRSNTEPAAFKVLLNETKDGGEYKCKAENEIPNLFKYSKGINITVKVPVSKPLIYPLLNSTEVQLGETVTLHCITSAGTLPITYTLYRNQSSLQSATTMQAIPAGFNITVHSMEHSGVYSCKAENQISSERSNGLSFHILCTQWWIYITIVLFSLVIIGLAILIARFRKLCSKNNEGISQEDESCKQGQSGPFQHNQGSLKKTKEVIYSKIGNFTHRKTDSDRNHEGDYTNIMSYERNVTEDDPESDCEADYTNVISKRKSSASADSDSSCDENNQVLYTQLDLAVLQNNNMPQPQGPTIYASIALDKLR